MSVCKVYIKQPGRHPLTNFIQDGLEDLQKIVGGYIETCTFEEGWTVLCNEDGRCLGLEDNCEIYGVSFVGPIIFIGTDAEEFCDVPFSYRDLQMALPELWEN